MTELPRDNFWPCPNRQLAIALAVAGVPWAPMEAGGPAVNTYTLGFIRQPRFNVNRNGKMVNRYAGVSLTDAAIDLYKRRIPGDVTYRFQFCKKRDEVIAAWDAMASERTQAAADDREPEMPQIPTAIIAQVVFVVANSMAEFNEIPFVNKMMQAASTLEGSVSSEPLYKDGQTLPGTRDTFSITGKVWSIFGKKETHQHLNV